MARACPVLAPTAEIPPFKLTVVVVVAPLPVTLASVSDSEVTQVPQVSVKLPPSATLPPPPNGPVVFIVIELLVNAAVERDPAGSETLPDATVNPVSPV